MKCLVFAGTTEGRAVIRILSEKKLKTEAFVATEYGQEILESEINKSDNITIHSSRLNLDEMKFFFKSQTEECIVIDATHPYAKDVTINLKKASKDTGLEYIRVLRKSTISQKFQEFSEQCQKKLIEFKTVEEVINWANKEENIYKKLLLTTGSKDLDEYSRITAYNQRVYVRILPDVPSLQKAVELGYKKSNIICMQGPFSVQMNEELIRATNTDILITKDTGKAGGFEEKIEASINLGINIGVIKRPSDENGELIDESGMDIDEFAEYINKITSNQIKEAYEYAHRFPMFFDIREKSIVVVGGGKIAQRRVETLLKYGAYITLIAPEQTDKLKALGESKKINILSKSYTHGDLEGAFLAVAATDSQEVNNEVYLEATRNQMHISVADNKAKCSFYFPAVIQHENISIGMVSDGNSHKKTVELAKELRNYLQLKNRGN